MADRPVVRIPVDTEEWQAFEDSFNHYQKVLNDQPAAWAGTNKGIKQAGAAFDHVEDTFAKVVKMSLDPKLTSQSSGAFVRLAESSKKTEKSWRSIGKD